MSSVEDLGKEILEIVADNFSYFKKNPVHLAWAMMNYELIYRIGDYTPNPRDAILSVAERFQKEEGDLLYDSWAVTVSVDYEFPDVNPYLSLELKHNKTMKEWIALLTNPSYRFRSLFPDEFSVKECLLCATSTGYGWNEGGFIANLGSSGVDKDIFNGYTRCENYVDTEIRKRILNVRSHPEIRIKAEAYWKEAVKTAERIYAGEDWSEAVDPSIKERWEYRERLSRELEEILGQLPEEIRSESNKKRLAREKSFPQRIALPKQEEKKSYLLSEYSNLVTMPENAHLSYVVTGIEIARHILKYLEGESESKRWARKILER